MLRTILTATWHQAKRHPRYTALNVFGLALGLCVFLLLGQYVRQQYAFNRSIPDADRIVRVDHTISRQGQAPVENAGLSFYALGFLRADFPQIVAATFDLSSTVMMRVDGKSSMQDVEETDADYFKTIPLALSQGDPATALSRPNGLIVSQSLARALFGAGPALGRTVNVNEAGVKTDAIVTGVLAPPDRATSIRPNALMQVPATVRHSNSIFTRWGSTGGSVYLRFKTVADLRSVESNLRDFLIRRARGPVNQPTDTGLGEHPERSNKLSFVSLDDMHFHDATVAGADGVNRAVVDGVGAIGLLALLLAIANAVNLATARATLRAREVAMRKTLGATRRDLIVQFMGESLLLTAIAGMIALSMCELLSPLVSALVGETLGGPMVSMVLLLLAAVVFTGLASGVYPALVVSAWPVAAVLAASKMPSGGRAAARTRNVLVVGQFTLAAMIAICTLVIDRQVNFVRQADAGYAREGIMVSPQIAGDDVAVQHRMLDALRAVPGVTSATLSMLQPNIHVRNWDLTSLPDGRRIDVLTDGIFGDYREVYRPRLLAGRWFDSAHGQDIADTQAANAPSATRSIVINARAVQPMGFASPADAIGKRLKDGDRQLDIIGVIADMRFISPHADIAPLVIGQTRKVLDDPVVTVRFAGIDPHEMQARLRRAWNALEPDVDGDFEPPQQLTAEFFETDLRQGKLFSIGSVVALIIACLGLYGLASFAGMRRRQEVGIRKALGATTGHVLALMLGEFLVPVLIACLIACPLAWGAMRAWLSSFSQRISLSPLDFLAVIAGAVIIATLTVAGQTWRVARAAPARALRAE